MLQWINCSGNKLWEKEGHSRYTTHQYWLIELFIAASNFLLVRHPYQKQFGPSRPRHDSSEMSLIFHSIRQCWWCEDTGMRSRVDLDSSYCTQNDPGDIVEPNQRARSSALIHQRVGGTDYARRGREILASWMFSHSSRCNKTSASRDGIGWERKKGFCRGIGEKHSFRAVRGLNVRTPTQ